MRQQGKGHMRAIMCMQRQSADNALDSVSIYVGVLRDISKQLTPKV